MIEIVVALTTILTGIITCYNFFSVYKKWKIIKKKKNELSEMIKQAESNLTSVNQFCIKNRGNSILYESMEDVENLQKILKEIYTEVEKCKTIDDPVKKQA